YLYFDIRLPYHTRKLHLHPGGCREDCQRSAENGSRVEIICMDAFGAKQLIDSPDVTFALLREGLVDIIATDFIGGYHDPILLVLQKAMDEALVTLPQAINMATNAPATYIPGVAPNRGLIEAGRV